MTMTSIATRSRSLSFQLNDRGTQLQITVTSKTLDSGVPAEKKAGCSNPSHLHQPPPRLPVAFEKPLQAGQQTRDGTGAEQPFVAKMSQRPTETKAFGNEVVVVEADVGEHRSNQFIAIVASRPRRAVVLHQDSIVEQHIEARLSRLRTEVHLGSYLSAGTAESGVDTIGPESAPAERHVHALQEHYLL
jgi:hypothetical protein